MKFAELGFRDYFEKYLVLACSWNLFIKDPYEFPWPQEADGLLVYAKDGYGHGLGFEILCPVVLDGMCYLVDKTPKSVHKRGFGMAGNMSEELNDVDVIVPDQGDAAALGLLSEHASWCNADRRRLLDATDLDPLRTPFNLDTFETLIDCGAHGLLPAKVRFEDYQDGMYRGRLLDMLDDEIDVYENDVIEVTIEPGQGAAKPRLMGRKVSNPRPRFETPELTDEERAALELWTTGLGSSAKRFAGEDPMPPKRDKATSSSWRNIREMPSRNEEFWLGMEISAAEKALLEYGHIPEAMEDHWFMYCEDDVIRYYRSWSGYCIYEAKIEPRGDHYVIGASRVNRYPGHYSETDIERDKYLLAQLVAWEVGRE